MTKNDFSKLTEKFSPLDIEWRVQSSGETNGKFWARVLAYVDARAIQDRLDLVCGAENWKDDYEHLTNGMICRLSIKVDGEWITKTNGAPETDIEGFKGGISKALVRTASTWGIGRYLYNLEASWANIVDQKTPGARRAQTKERKDFYWLPPELPEWAYPNINPIDDALNERPAALNITSKSNHGGEHEFSSEPSKDATPKCKCGGTLVPTAKKDAYRCHKWTIKSGKNEHDYLKNDVYDGAVREMKFQNGKVS